MQNMTYLFHGIAETIIAKLICIKLINNKYKCELKDIVDLKKTSIIYNTKECSGVIVKLNIIFIIFNKKNLKKMLCDLTKKNNKNLLLGSNLKSLIY